MKKLTKSTAEKIKIGDLITALDKGWYIVTKISPRSIYTTDLIQYRLAVDSDFNIYKNAKKDGSSILKKCDASYCKIVSKEELKKERQHKMDLLSKAYDFLLDVAKD